MESKRQERIQKLLQRDLGEIFQREIGHVTQNAMVTVTKVYVTPDLSLARIYLSLFATRDKAALMQRIAKSTKEIRRKLGERIRHQLRVVPELQFFEDDSLDYIDRIDKLLKDDQ
jgi:ribosome-binding factor A